MTRIHIRQPSASRVPFGIEEGRKPGVIRDLMKMTVEARTHLQRRLRSADQGSQHRLEIRHKDGRGDPFTAYVADRKNQPPIGELDNIVVVAADSASGDAYRGELEPAAAGQGSRE